MKKWIGLLGLCAWTAQAEVTLAPAFSDYMVLQRGAVVPVWGTAKPGEKVTVDFAGQTKRTVAAAFSHSSASLSAWALQPHP